MVCQRELKEASCINTENQKRGVDLLNAYRFITWYIRIWNILQIADVCEQQLLVQHRLDIPRLSGVEASLTG